MRCDHLRALALTVLAATILAQGCSRKPSASSDPAAVEKKSQPTTASCGRKPSGIERLLEPSSLTVFGEMHGTSETPAFVSNVACHAAQAGREVIVGLEIPNSLQGQVDRFLHSEGTASDVEALLQGQFWTYRDGRSSKAMLTLMDQLRLLTKSGKNVRILLFDGLFFLEDQRDPGMATNIVAGLDKAPQAVALILVGNLHAKADSERWMAWHLAKRYPHLRSLNVSYSGGSAWVCMGDDECGPNDLSGQDRGTEQFVELLDAPDSKGYGGIFYVGAVTASAPATQKGDSPSPKARQSSETSSLRSQGNRSYEAKDYPTCARLFLEAAVSSSGARGTNDLYNAACCQALAGDREGAFESLKQATERGLRDVEHLKQDPDLKALHDDPRWRSLVVDAETKAKAAQSKVNQELAQLYRDDQGDRHGDTDKIDWATVGPRDIARRKRVRQILDTGGAKVAADYFHAAMVFQHGSELDDYRMAHELAVKASELDPNDETAKWLAAAAKDRLLMNNGKPQLYGTQFTMRNGKWELYEVDPNVTDDARAKWNVPPLAEAKKRAEEMNRK